MQMLIELTEGRSEMKKWLVLAGAIALEVTATMALRGAIDNLWWAILAVAGYAGAFIALSLLSPDGCTDRRRVTESGQRRASR